MIRCVKENSGAPTPDGQSTARPDHRRQPGWPSRLLALAAALLVGQTQGVTQASAALVRVDLGIHGGRSIDLDACTDSTGQTRVIAAVEGDAAGFILDAASTVWSPIFFGRPGEIQALEVPWSCNCMLSS